MLHFESYSSSSFAKPQETRFAQTTCASLRSLSRFILRSRNEATLLGATVLIALLRSLVCFLLLHHLCVFLLSLFFYFTFIKIFCASLRSLSRSVLRSQNEATLLGATVLVALLRSLVFILFLL